MNVFKKNWVAAASYVLAVIGVIFVGNDQQTFIAFALIGLLNAYKILFELFRKVKEVASPGDLPLYNTRCQNEDWRSDPRSVGKGFTMTDIEYAIHELQNERPAEKEEFGDGFHNGGHDQK